MTFEVIIIGSGQAGVPLATRLAGAGKQVLIVERAALGGTCVNTGCTPTKTMVAAARAAHIARTAGRLGVRAGPVEIDLAAIVDRKDAMVRRWSEGVGRRLQGERLTVERGHARFVGDRKVEVEGRVHEAKEVIINVGARPAVPELAGLHSVPWLDNATVMKLREVPSHLLVLGGGYIGCEFGQMFRRFGAQVTIVDHHEHLLAREDPEISTALEDAFGKEGLHLALGAKAASVSGDTNAITLRLANGRELRGSHLLVCVGRRPNTDDLGCEQAGIVLDEQGSVVIDDDYRTSAPGIYAVGDATGGPMFTHTSWDDHRRLFDLLLARSQKGRRGRVVPYAVFTDPQVAGVGLTEKEARRQGLDFEVATMPFGNIARAIELDEPAGILKVLIDPKTERVLGAFIVGAEAGELIHVFVALLQASASVRAIVDAEFVHPTFSEGVQSLVMKLPRFSLS